MTITNVKEYDILPSRWDYFERRMEKLKEAAGRKIPLLISSIQANLLRQNHLTLF